jgi:hypothetical protein
MNNHGHVVFYARLAGNGVDQTNDWSLWAASPSGELTLIARTGDAIDINPHPDVDDVRVIETLLENGLIEPFFWNQLNDNGAYTFHARFTDGEAAVLVAELPASDAGPDLNGDGLVTSDDLFQLLGAWGDCAACPADLNGDGMVDSDDLFQLLGAWGPVGEP